MNIFLNNKNNPVFIFCLFFNYIFHFAFLRFPLFINNKEESSPPPPTKKKKERKKRCQDERWNYIRTFSVPLFV